MSRSLRNTDGLSVILVIFCGLMSSAAYLWLSEKIYGVGFPLDDAWIHQTYARNLTCYGEWSFLPGKPSAGSTAPLWTLLIALGRLLHLDPLIWTYGIGTVISILLGLIVMNWFVRRNPIQRKNAWLVGIFMVLEWHLSWAAVSGMETLAFAIIAILVLSFIDCENWNPLVIGLLIGVGMWIRPGSISLLLPAGIAVWKRDRSHAWIRLVKIGIGFALLLTPYLLFNNLLTGAPWPNTFYAKQAEYAVMRNIPIPIRYVRQFIQPITGIGVILLPGILLCAARSIKGREWKRLIPLLWAFLYLGIYALQLPVTYQHGRYAIPAIPILVLIGSEGLLNWVELDAIGRGMRLISRFWLLSSIVVVVGFWFIGARAYAEDVAIIETEMVRASKWINENTERRALIAAHDIGALGYYGNRDILDLAGLVSPEVIPIIRDEEALALFLTQEQADYLMTFPNWYPKLTKESKIVYKTNGEFSPKAGGENMALYEWGR